LRATLVQPLLIIKTKRKIRWNPAPKRGKKKEGKVCAHIPIYSAVDLQNKKIQRENNKKKMSGPSHKFLPLNHVTKF